MEEGKRGRGPAEEEGVEAKEDVGDVEDKAKEGAGGDSRRDKKHGEKIFLVDMGKGDSLTETAPPEDSGIKVADDKDLECPPQTQIKELHTGSERGAEKKDEDEDVKTVEVEEGKCDVVFETSPKCVGIKKAHEVRESENRSDTVGEEELESDEEKETEEQVEEYEVEEEENEKGDKGIVSSYGKEKDFKEAIKAELEENKLEGVFAIGESDKPHRDNEVKGSKSMQSTGDEIFLELKNKYSPAEVENSFGCGVANRGKLSQAESSGEWEFVDTGGHFTENENDGGTLGEREGQYPYNKYASSAKGLFLGSFLGNTDNARSPGAVGMGMEKVNDLLQSFVDISKGEERASSLGTSPKREGEELYGMRMTLDEWEGEKRRVKMGPETEVVVEEFDLLGDWEGGGGTIGFFEVTTKEHEECNRKDEDEVEVGGKTGKKEHDKHVEGYGERGIKQSGRRYPEHECESSSVSVEEEAKSDESESHSNRKDEDVGSNCTEDDADIEEIVRTEPDEWSKRFTFTDTDQRSAFRNLEDLLGGEFSFRMTAASAQFNLWSSQEAFGGKGTWMEHIDMDAFMSTAQSQQQSSSGTGLLKNMTTFAKTFIVGDHKGSSTTYEQRHFSRGGGDGERRKNLTLDEEEDIVLVEQDFDDRSDEIEGNLEPRSHWGSTYHAFDVGSHPGVKKGDAFIIFESPGKTTFANQEGEMSSDEDTDDKPGIGNNVRKATLCEDDVMEGLELDGEWEEGVIFLDDDDAEDAQTGDRRGSGEYRNFGDEVVEKEENELWGTIPQSNEDLASGDLAFAIVMDAEDQKEKTPVLPTGRWCPRLPILSPAMSAISEEESEEIFPEKEEKMDRESEPFQTENAVGYNITTENREIKKPESENNLKDSALPEPSSRDEAPEDNVEYFGEDEESECLKVTLLPDDDEMNNIQAETLEEGDTKHELPTMDVEVEDGFGESFTKRRSSTSSVVSDSGTPEPAADCGAAFVVSSELAVTLALGVSITQIIPPIIDLPEIPPLPQVEEGTDALCIDKTEEEQRLGHCKEEPLKTEGEKDCEQILEVSQQHRENAGVKVEGTYHTISNVNEDGKIQIWRKTIETQTEPVLVLEEIKELVDNSVMVDENLLKMETIISDPENKELESEIGAQGIDFDVSKLVTREENVEGKSFLLIEKSHLAPEVVAFKIQGEYHEGKEKRNESKHFRERDVNEENSKGEQYEFDDSKKERVDGFMNNTTGAIKRTLGATSKGIGKDEVAKSKNHRDLIAFETGVVEKGEKKFQRESQGIGEENRVEGKERGNIPSREQESECYDDEGEGIECWSNGRLVTMAMAERNGVEHKKFEEEKGIVLEEKEKAPDKERSVLPAGGTSEENNRRAESTTKSSPPVGVRKKESLEEKSKDSPPRTIPLEKLLGWSSGNGNGNGLGCSGVASRRESVFDDYNFSLWENGFQLNSDAGNQRIKSQDSTGLEYYLDVDQLLNVPLAATEPEVKYVSAKEIMETFTRGEGIDSPEKIVEKEVASRRGKEGVFKSDLLDEEAAGGSSTEFAGGGLMEGAIGFSNERGGVTVSIAHGADPLEDDLFSECPQGSVLPVPKTKREALPMIFTNQEGAISYTPLDEDRKDNTLSNIIKEGVQLEEKIDEGGVTENLVPDLKIQGENFAESDTDLIIEFGTEEGKIIQMIESKNVYDQKKHEVNELSNKEVVSGTGAQKEMQTSGRKVRNIIDIFERPSSTEMKKETSPAKKDKGEKNPLSIFAERTPTEEIKRPLNVAGLSQVGANQPTVQRKARELTEAEDETRNRIDRSSPIALSPLVSDTGEGVINSEVESLSEKQKEEGESVLTGRTSESKSTESTASEAKEIFNGRAKKLTDVKTPTIEDQRGALLSLTEEPVVGWEAIKVATEVEKIILSTGNGAEQKKIMGGVVIGVEPDKIFGAMQQTSEVSVKNVESGSRKENIRESTEARWGLGDIETLLEESAVGESSYRRKVQDDARKSRIGRLSTSSSFEEYRTVVNEAYQFLESLRDTVDEDEERQTEEGAKEPGGKTEGSVCGTGSEVEEFHPCEELPSSGIEAIPRGVEGAPMEGLVETQSSPSSPEISKTTESSSSSSPYSSLPTFADVSSGILSSASSRDENFAKAEDNALRERTYKSEFRGAPVVEAERAADGGSLMPGDYLDEEIDSCELAKMNVASRKEYWDRRLQRVQEKNREVVTVGAKKPPPLRVSGIVARGRMSFEKRTSRDEYTTSDSGGDGGKSSSESSPSSRGKSFSQRPKSLYSRGTRDVLPSQTEVKAKGEEKNVLLEEKKILKTLEELSTVVAEKGSDGMTDKDIPTDASDTKQKEHPLKKSEDKDDLSQIPVAKRKEIWDQKLQKMSEDESPPSSLEYRRIEKKKSSRVQSTKKLMRNLSTEGKTEKTAPSKGIVQKEELEEQSLSLDSSSLDDKLEHEEVIKKSPPIKPAGSVSRLAKLFSSPTPEPPPPKYGSRPIPKGKYSKGLDKGNLKSNGESIEETTAKTEIYSPKIAQGMSHSKTPISGTDTRVPRQDESTTEALEKVPIEGKNEKKIEHDRRISSNASIKKTPLHDTANSSSYSTENITSEIDNLASRRKKYLESVQQSMEREENRNENMKKSESEDSMKERIGRKGITDVRNVWEKRASLDSSDSISESIKKSGKIKSTVTNTEKKKTAQDEKPTARVNMESLDKTNELQLQGEALQESRQIDPALAKSVSQEEAFTIAASNTHQEAERQVGDTSHNIVISRQGIHLKEEAANNTLVSLSEQSKGGNETDFASSDTCRLREGKLSSDGEPSQKIIQSTIKSAQQPDLPNRDDERRKLPTSSDRATESNKGKATGKRFQHESKASLEERAPEEKFAPKERRAPPAQIKSPPGKSLPPDTEGTPPSVRPVSAEATSPSAFKGRRHSSACVIPPKNMDVSRMRERWGSLEEKVIESVGSMGKKDSLEIRVTDDEDICVMREVTSVPRFPPKEKMETHEEEDGRHAEGEEGIAAAEEERSKAPPPSTTGAKRKSLPPRTLSIQVSGIVASGRRRFEGGKATAEDMPTLQKEVGEKPTKTQGPRNPSVARRGAEERRRTPTRVGGLEEVEEVEQGREGERVRLLASSKGRRVVGMEALREEGTRPRSPEASGRELYRAVPVSVTVEGEHRGTEIRVEICDLEEPSLASKGGGGGDDGRSATSRRAPKGKAPAQKQSPPSAASSPDTESEGATENKLLSFLSTPAAQVRRHSAVDVATLRSFTAAAPEEPRMRRRGSGDLGTPSRPREDESKKRFSRARQFFETLEKGKESPPSPPQSGPEDSAPVKAPSGTQSAGKKKKKKPKDVEEEGAWRASVGRRAGGAVKHRPHIVRGSKDSSESTTESDKEKKYHRKARRSASEKTHSAPGSDVDSSSSASHNHPSLHRRRRDKEFVIRSQRFGGSEREVKVSERFNVMDLFRDVAGPGTGVTSGRATPLGIPHQAAVLAALRSVEDVRRSETTSPYDMYRPVEADNDCEPKAAAEDEGGEPGVSPNDENANVEEEGNVTFSSPMTLCVKKEYQAEYPHLPMTSPRHSRHRSSNTDLIPRNVLLQLDTNQDPPKKSTSSRRSIAELF